MSISGLSSRTSKGHGDHATVLGQVLERYEDELETENENREELLKLFRTIRSWIGEDIKLDPASLGEAFKGAKEAYLDQSCNLVITSANGEAIRKPLDGLPAQLFLVVAWDAAPNLLKLVSAKAESVVSSKKPLLAASIVIEGNGFRFTSGATPLLSILNSGGDANDLRVTLRAREGSGSPGKNVSYEPAGLAHNARRDLSLESLRNCIGARVSLEVACTDSDGRPYEGRGEIEVRNGQSQIIQLISTRK